MHEHVEIRRGEPSDAREIARVHVDSWRDVYRGILPDETLAALSIDEREAGWRERLEKNPDLRCWVAGTANELVGFAAGGPERGRVDELEGELYAIYLKPSHYRLGIGTSLFRRVTNDLIAQGHSSMLVWVLEANGLARRFYERMGGEQLVVRPLEMLGGSYVSVGYAWHDLPAILHAGFPIGR